MHVMTLSCADDIPGARSDALVFVMLLFLFLWCSWFCDAPLLVMLLFLWCSRWSAWRSQSSPLPWLWLRCSLFGSDDDVDFWNSKSFAAMMMLISRLARDWSWTGRGAPSSQCVCVCVCVYKLYIIMWTYIYIYIHVIGARPSRLPAGVHRPPIPRSVILPLQTVTLQSALGRPCYSTIYIMYTHARTHTHTHTHTHYAQRLCAIGGRQMRRWTRHSRQCVSKHNSEPDWPWCSRAGTQVSLKWYVSISVSKSLYIYIYICIYTCRYV